jgi:hypothetical protein
MSRLSPFIALTPIPGHRIKLCPEDQFETVDIGDKFVEPSIFARPFSLTAPDIR